jgi:carbon monoxide dehydrogenase subunit G
MDLTGEYRIPAPRAKVWAALNDPEILKQCIEGCEELNKDSDNAFTAKVTAKVGPVKAKFAGKVTLENIDAPNGYTIRGEGQGGVAGFAKGSADVKLKEEGAETVLTYLAGRRQARLGRQPARRRRREEDGRRLLRQIQPDRGRRRGGGLVPAEAPQGEPKDEGLSPWLWGTALVAVIGILWYVLGR